MSNLIDLPDVEIPDAFKPCAVFDVHLDCIRVLVRDVSVCEVRIDESLTVYRENFPSGFGRPYVGFALKGVNHLLYGLGLEEREAVRLSEILDAIVNQRPATVMAVVLDLIREPLGDIGDCEIQIVQDAA
jgi:hypothetical protein